MTKVKKLGELLPYLVLLVLITGITSVDAFAFIFMLYAWWKYSEEEARVWLTKNLNFLIIFIPLTLYFAHVFKHWSFSTHAWDMSFTHQPIFYPFLTPLLHNDLSINNTFLGEHLAFTFFPVGLIFQYIKNDYAVFLFHAFLLSTAAWALVRFGPTRRNSLPLWVFFIFLMASKTFRGAFLFDFREDSLAFFGLCLTLLFLFYDKWIGFTLSLLWTLLSKENYSLITIFMVVPIFLDPRIKKEKKFLYIATTLVLSLTWAFISFKFLIPHYTAGVEKAHPIMGRFGEFGSTPKEILINILTVPTNWIKLISKYLLTWGRIKYLLYLILPVILFCRRSWFWLVPALPGLAMNLFSSSHNQVMMVFHYDLMILPFLFWALLLGLSETNNARKILLGLLFALTFSGKWPGYFIQKFIPKLTDIQNSFYLENLPEKNITAANLNVLAHLNHLPHFRVLDTSATNWDEFQNANQHPDSRTRLKAFEATHFVLDLSEPKEKNLDSILISKAWKLVSESVDGRFHYLKKP